MSRILIIEDEVAIADLEKDYLELSGFEVLVENDGMNGLGRALAEDFDFIMNVCLERDHINMVITKIQAMLSTGKITQLVFASVIKSPHCIQLHYIKNEIKRSKIENLPPIFSFIVNNNELHFINSDVIVMSKDIVTLSKMVEKSKEIKLPHQG